MSDEVPHNAQQDREITSLIKEVKGITTMLKGNGGPGIFARLRILENFVNSCMEGIQRPLYLKRKSVIAIRMLEVSAMGVVLYGIDLLLRLLGVIH